MGAVLVPESNCWGQAGGLSMGKMKEVVGISQSRLRELRMRHAHLCGVQRHVQTPVPVQLGRKRRLDGSLLQYVENRAPGAPL